MPRIPQATNPPFSYYAPGGKPQSGTSIGVITGNGIELLIYATPDGYIHVDCAGHGRMVVSGPMGSNITVKPKT